MIEHTSRWVWISCEIPTRNNTLRRSSKTLTQQLYVPRELNHYYCAIQYNTSTCIIVLYVTHSSFNVSTMTFFMAETLDASRNSFREQKFKSSQSFNTCETSKCRTLEALRRVVPNNSNRSRWFGRPPTFHWKLKPLCVTSNYVLDTQQKYVYTGYI